jgi:uncharacterized protein (UPF0303 family)
MTEELPDFDHFNHDDAWRMGWALVERCRADGLPIVISIRLGEQRVFHVALPGTSADNDYWVERKINVVRRFDLSTMDVHDRYRKAVPDLFTAFGLSRAEFAPGEGGVPIRVRGTQVGVLAVSGLDGGGDHEVVLAGLREAAAAQRERDQHVIP